MANKSSRSTLKLVQVLLVVALILPNFSATTKPDQEEQSKVAASTAAAAQTTTAAAPTSTASQTSANKQKVDPNTSLVKAKKVAKQQRSSDCEYEKGAWEDCANNGE